ncbi:MAG TPA: hypothetical protein O0X32_01875, partial [Methanocorpusculum sp.]|nr:hypothetical protein [Methanocorpusculum sp.]
FYGGSPQFLLITADELTEVPRYLEKTDAYAVVPRGNMAYLMISSGDILGKKLSPVSSSKRVDVKKW